MQSEGKDFLELVECGVSMRRWHTFLLREKLLSGTAIVEIVVSNPDIRTVA